MEIDWNELTGKPTPRPVFTIADTEPTAHVIMTTGETEMLKITNDGFWVRGVKVPQDDKEAVTVYNAFLQWMSYMALTRNY
jgi:hypothetical protein